MGSSVKIYFKKYWMDTFFILMLIIPIIMVFQTTHIIINLDGDMSGYEYGVFATIANAMHHGELPFWFPNVFGGTYGGHNFINMFYPITLVLCKIFYNTETMTLSYGMVVAYEMIHLYIMSVGMYCVCKSSGIKSYLSFFIASVSGIMGCVFFSVFICKFFSAISWVPFLILCTNNMAKGTKDRRLISKYTIYTALMIALIILANTAQGGMLALIVYPILFLVYVFYHKGDKNDIKFLFINFFIAGMIGICLAAPQVLPIVRNLRYSYRLIPGVDSMDYGGTMPFTRFVESDLKSSLCTLGRSFSGPFAFGIVGVVGIIFGFFSKQKKDKELWVLGKIIFVLCITMSLNIFGVADVAYYLPIYNKISELYLYILVLPIGAFLVMACGVNSFYEFICEYNYSKDNVFNILKKHFYNPILMGILLLLTVGVWLLPHNFRNDTFIQAVACVMILGIGFKKYRGKHRNKIKNVTMCLFLAGILITNIYTLKKELNIGRYTVSEAITKTNTVLDSVRQIFKECGEPRNEDVYRVMPYNTKQAYSYDIMSILNGYDCMGYWNPISTKALDLHWNVSLNKRATLQNARYLIVSEKESEDYISGIEALGFKKFKTIKGVYPTFDSDTTENIILYTVEDTNGPAWLVYDYAVYDDNMNAKQMSSMVKTVDLKKFAYVKENKKISKADLKEGTISEVKVKEYKFNSIKYEVNTDADALLVTTESSYPGWKVYVDGKRQELLEVNYFLNGVMIESGTHEVELRYKPISIVVGGTMFFIGVFGIVFIAFMLNKRRI